MERSGEVQYEITPDHFFIIVGINKYAAEQGLRSFTRRFREFIKNKLTHERYPVPICETDTNEIIRRAEDVYELRDLAFYTIRNMVNSVVCNPTCYQPNNLIVRYVFPREQLKQRFCRAYCDEVANNLVQQASFIVHSFCTCEEILDKWNIYEDARLMAKEISANFEREQKKRSEERTRRRTLRLPPISPRRSGP